MHDNQAHLWRSGTELIKATAIYAQERPALSWTLTAVSFLLLGLCWTLALTIPVLAVQMLAAVLVGLLLVRCFVLYHDQQHGAILRGSRFGALLMRGFGVLVLAPASAWTGTHETHHRSNSRQGSGFVGSFSVYSVEQWRAAGRWERLAYRAERHPLIILFAYPLVFILKHCLVPLLRDPRRHLDCGLALLLHVAIGCVLWWSGGWLLLLIGQTIPFAIAGCLGTYLFYAQHTFPGVRLCHRADWNYHDAALLSSSYMRMGPVMRWFTANIGYHHIHHLNARIPFYRLPQAMREMPELDRATRTSLHPREIWRCLRLDLWDDEADRMVSLRAVRRHRSPA
ncbi:MAG: fatty acid desaturase family protein [Planctomycetota bacterium]